MHIQRCTCSDGKFLPTTYDQYHGIWKAICKNDSVKGYIPLPHILKVHTLPLSFSNQKLAHKFCRISHMNVESSTESVRYFSRLYLTMSLYVKQFSTGHPLIIPFSNIFGILCTEDGIKSAIPILHVIFILSVHFCIAYTHMAQNRMLWWHMALLWHFPVLSNTQITITHSTGYIIISL